MKLLAITRAVGPALARCELTFLAREPIDVDRARLQHAAYHDALRRAGAEVETLPAEPDLPDAVFVEDTAVVLDEVAIITRPGAESRRGEVASIARALARYRTLARIDPPATLDGGDVLRVGREIFVGRSSRTNAAGIAQLAALAGRHGCRVTPVDVRGCLHLKSAVTAIDDETIVINRTLLDAAPFRRFRALDVDPTEDAAANVLALGGIVHVSARFPRTRAAIDAAGFETLALDLSELEKAEGALTCGSLVFRA